MEVLIGLFLMGIVAIFALPKLFNTNQDMRVTNLMRESFATLGDMYIMRKSDMDYPPENIGGGEPATFGNYLYRHLNYLSAINPATVSNYCTPNNYFVLPMGATVRSICETATNLQVRVRVPAGETTVEYVMVMPEGQDRYTTLYGVTGNAGDCGNADVIFNVTNQCP